MADTTSIASRMEKLAQLKRMKKGLSTDIEAPTDADIAPQDDFEAIVNAPDLNASEDRGEPVTGFEEAGAADPEKSEDRSVDAGQPAEANVEGGDSLNDYFTALGITPNADADAGDAHEAAVSESAAAETAEADVETTESLLNAADLGIDDEAMEALDNLVALAGVGADDEGDAPEPVEFEGPTLDEADFAQAEVDPDTLEREFEDEVSETAAGTTMEEVDGRIAVTFDQSRTALLNHVSRQMDCSVEDVVVTALDWYLDALFGEEEGEAQAS